jgi:hypothetical protein
MKLKAENRRKCQQLFVSPHSISHLSVHILYPICQSTFYIPFVSPHSISHLSVHILYSICQSTFYIPFVSPHSISHLSVNILYPICQSTFYIPFVGPRSISHLSFHILYPICQSTFYIPFVSPHSISQWALIFSNNFGVKVAGNEADHSDQALIWSSTTAVKKPLTLYRSIKHNDTFIFLPSANQRITQQFSALSLVTSHFLSH